MRLTVVAALLLTGCAAWPIFPTEATRLLDRADALVARQQYQEALLAYDDVKRLDPDGRAGASAAARRELVGSLVAARDQIARLREELRARQTEIERVSKDLATRETEITRLRQEVSSRQGEMEQLRADLENLKRIEMRLERRR